MDHKMTFFDALLARHQKALANTLAKISLIFSTKAQPKIRIKQNMQCLKGQTFLIDIFIFLTASVVVFLLFLFMLSTTNTFRAQDERMQKAIENAADILVSQGDPINWGANLSNIHILGLADRKGVIDLSKLSLLNQTEYTDILSLNPYNISIQILDQNSVIYSTGWINASAAIAVTDRIVLYNDTARILRVKASKES